MNSEATFGRLLREARQRALLTLEGLAEASGVSVRAISDMERGQSLPRQATLSELLDALELDESERRRLVHAAARREGQAPQQLPPDLAAFSGRQEALAAVRGVLPPDAGSGGQVVISAIGGMAGVGKTTLAVHYAHQVADRFPDGQLYVNLRGFEDTERPLDPGLALAGFLGALGVPNREIPRGVEERGALFREQTASRRMIVLLDNARDEEQVRPLLTPAAGCLTIVTSRNRLSGLAEHEGASLVGLDIWTRDEALAALASRIGEERCLAEPEAAGRLVELCGYLPLAVAVVGAQLSAASGMSLRFAVQELEEARLDALSVGDRRVDVRAVFSWSYRALSPGTARVFRHLALHPGPAASVEAAASLAGVEVGQVRRHLRELASASLVSRDAEGRYVLHDLVRAYGIELVEQEGDDRLTAETRLLDYLRHNAYVAGLHVSRYKEDPPGPAAEGVVLVEVGSRGEGLDWYRQEEATTAAVVRAVRDPRLLRRCVDLVLSWVGYNTVVGRWAEEAAAERIALDAALVLDEPLCIVRSALNLARALVETGNLDEPDEVIEVAQGRMDRLADADRARAEGNIGWIRDYQKRPVESIQHSRNALALYRKLRQHDKIARALSDMSWDLAALGDHQESIAACEEALPMLREAGDRRTEANTWSTLGYARQGLGDLDAAVSAYEQSLRILEEVLDHHSQAETWDLLASAQLERGDREKARAGWTRAAELFETLRVARAEEMRAKARSAGGEAGDTAGDTAGTEDGRPSPTGEHPPAK